MEILAPILFFGVIGSILFSTIYFTLIRPYLLTRQGVEDLMANGYFVKEYSNSPFNCTIEFDKTFGSTGELRGKITKDSGVDREWEVELEFLFGDGMEPKEEFGINDYYFKCGADEGKVIDAVEKVKELALYRKARYTSLFKWSLSSLYTTMEDSVREKTLEDISVEELKECSIKSTPGGNRLYEVPYSYESEFLDEKISGHVRLSPDEYLSLLARKTDCTELLEDVV